MPKYVQVVDFISNLTEKFAKDDRDLPIFAEHLVSLANKLGNGGYTYLQVRDGTNIEIVKVSADNGRLLVTRGQENTEATTFPKGSCIEWKLTTTAVRDIVCQMDCCP